MYHHLFAIPIFIISLYIIREWIFLHPQAEEKNYTTYSAALFDLFSLRDLCLFLFQLTYLPIIISKFYLNQHKIPLSSLLSYKISQYM